MIKIAVLDDHTVIIEGIQRMLENMEHIQFAFGCTTPDALSEKLSITTIDILLLDINLGSSNGIELCKQLKNSHPEIGIIALTNFEDINFVKQMIKNGAIGYLLKNTSKTELLTAIQCVQGKELYIADSIQKALLQQSLGQGSNNQFIPRLTRREKEVLQLIVKEQTTQEIAKILYLSPKTIEAHRSNLIQKFGVRNVVGLVRVAIEKGLV